MVSSKYDVNPYTKWEQRKTQIPEGIYLLHCFHAAKRRFEFRHGQKEMMMVVLLFETDYDSKSCVIPHYCRIPDENKIGQRSHYYRAWTLAAGHPPDRPRLRDMPLYVLEGKYFEGIITYHKPLESEEVSRQLYMFDDLNECVCICGGKESEHPVNGCKKFEILRRTVPPQLWWSKVTVITKKIPIPTAI